jgi:heme exporter protein D
MTEFFAMNGYGFYIWSAYGVAALALVIELSSLRSRRRAATELARLAALDAATDAAEAPQ